MKSSGRETTCSDEVKEELLAFKRQVEALGLEVKFFDRRGFVELEPKKEEKMKKGIPSYRIGLLTDTAEKKFEAAWSYAKAVRDACKTVNKDCVEPFNRAVEEFEKDLNEIRELAGLEGKTELPRLKEAILEEIGRFERGVIPKVIWELQRAVVEKAREGADSVQELQRTFEEVETKSNEDCDLSP